MINIYNFPILLNPIHNLADSIQKHIRQLTHHRNRWVHCEIIINGKKKQIAIPLYENILYGYEEYDTQ